MGTAHSFDRCETWHWRHSEGGEKEEGLKRKRRVVKEELNIEGSGNEIE